LRTPDNVYKIQDYTACYCCRIFSAVVFYELIEQPFSILDMELEEEADRAVQVIDVNEMESIKEPLNPHILDTFPTWLKIYEHNSDKVLWKSKVTERVMLPGVKPGSATTVDAIVRDDESRPGQGGAKKAAFRTSTFELMAAGKNLRVQVGLPMVKLKEEIQELVLGLIAGLIFSTLALIVISYFVAGRIIKPIGEMKDLTQVISEKNLDKRIPVDAGRDEFTELARTINMMLDRLQFSFEKQRDFLFDTSHELKTPLTTIRLAIDDICASETMDNLHPALKENLLRVTEQVVRMERLVKDLLNLSALEVLTGLDPKPVNITKILTSLIEDYGPIAASRNINIDNSISGEMVIRGDEEKIKRALSNILDNAIKYNSDGGMIEITADKSDTEINISAANTGHGVSETDVSRVFDQFYRVEKSRSTNHGGSGLGLAMVKRIVELHGGKVNFESRQGEWTRVIVRLPQYMNSFKKNRNGD
jgi:two-component system OmpR family sensor kinase